LGSYHGASAFTNPVLPASRKPSKIPSGVPGKTGAARLTATGTKSSTSLSAIGTKARSGWHAGGQLWPIVSKLFVGPEKARQVVKEVVEATLWQDIAILIVLAYVVPLMRKGKTFGRRFRGNNEAESDDNLDDPIETSEDEEASLWGIVRDVDLIPTATRRFARVSLLAYLVEVVCITLKALGFKNNSLGYFPSVFAKVAYSLWALRGFLRLKTIALCRFYDVRPDDMGRFEIFDRLIGGFTTAVALLLLGDWLSVKMGLALKGIVTVGSVGTLAFTFATKDLVSHLISGLALSATNKVGPGEDVLFGNGIKGKIIKVGWLETIIREGDSTFTVIPNSMLAGNKISNLSRVKISQVAQTLRFHYEDADKIPAVIESIKKEIKISCPELITNGLRPFRVYWTDFKEDHLEVMVNTNFYIPPLGDKYYINRQKVLMAISRAVKEHGVTFACFDFLEFEGEEGSKWRVARTMK